MDCHISYSWNHDFPRLIRDTGFQFTSKCPKILIDWNAIGNININKVIDSREVITLEQHLNDIIYYRIHGEESKLLDQKFLKLFRLAQLTIEYLLFCLHYLDQGLVQLQKNVIDLTEEADNLRKENKQKDKILNKSKKQINELQNMLSNSLPAIFTCSVCNKQFISMEYLETHQLKRHNEKISVKNDTYSIKYEEQLQLEIKQLKERLNNTERMVDTNLSKNNSTEPIKQDNVDKYPLINQSVQCNLIELNQITINDKEEQIKIIKNELQKWKEQEQIEFLTQLEQLKNKLYTEIEKLKPPKDEENSNKNLNNTQSIKKEEIKAPNITKKETSSNLEIETIAETLTKKVNVMVKSHIDQLQDQLVKQEKKWEEYLMQIEHKYNTELSQIQSSLTIKGDNLKKINRSTNNAGSSLDTSTSEIALPFKIDVINEKSPNYTFKVMPEIPNEKKVQSEQIEKLKPIKSFEKKEIDTDSSSVQSESYNLLKKKEILKTFIENSSENFNTDINDHLKNSVKSNHIIYTPKPNPKSIDTIIDNASYLKSNSNEQLIPKPIINQYNKVIQQIKQKKQSDLLKKNNTDQEQKNHNEAAGSEFIKSTFKHAESNNYKIKEFNKINQADKRFIRTLKDKKALDHCEVTVNNMLTEKLHEMGIDPNWQTLPSETLKKHLNNLQHSQTLVSKSYPSYFQLCNNILSIIEKHTTEYLRNKKYSLNIDLQQDKILKSKITSQNKNAKVEVSKINSSKKKAIFEECNEIKKNVSIQENIIEDKDSKKYKDIHDNYLNQEKKPYKSIKLKDQLLPTSPDKFNSIHKSYVTKYLVSKQHTSTNQDEKINDSTENKKTDSSYKNSNKSNMTTCTFNEISTSSSSESLKQELLAKISINKSVLKSADSIGSLTKKKVLFDIESSQSIESNLRSNEEKFPSLYKSKKQQSNKDNILSDKQILHQNVINIPVTKVNTITDEDETTSISSSIFEGNKDYINNDTMKENNETNTKVKKLKELDDLIISDFDSLS